MVVKKFFFFQHLKLKSKKKKTHTNKTNLHHIFKHTCLLPLFNHLQIFLQFFGDRDGQSFQNDNT